MARVAPRICVPNIKADLGDCWRVRIGTDKSIVEMALLNASHKPIHFYFGMRDERDIY